VSFTTIVSKRPVVAMVALLLGVMAAPPARSQGEPLVLHREGRVISLVPYAPNIVRVTISPQEAAAAGEPGYGFVGAPSPQGWTHESAPQGELYRSAEMIVRLSPENAAPDQSPRPMPLDALNLQLRDPYFGGPGGPRRPNDSLEISTPGGKTLVSMRGWSMDPEQPEVARFDGDPKGRRVSAVFDSRADEHYYGLGQQQQGWMDLRDHEIQCWHDYNRLGGESVCVPFLVSTRGYGLIWDNPSKTTIDLGFNDRNTWSSEVGDRVSFFVIAGETSDAIYEGYRLLTGVTHLLPRADYGYIQSKAIYPTQQQILDVAAKYRAKNLPLDVMVVDFLNMTRQGELDLDPKRWPDPAAMNRQLHAMHMHTMLSVWPHFSEGTQFYDMLLSKGWLILNQNGTPDLGGYRKNIGPNIDTTNPEAGEWFWEKIRDRYIKPYGFDSIWLDETEPDVDPSPDKFSIGSGTRYYNVYPLFHTSAVYSGFRRDFGDSRRLMILARAAYLGAQRNGTVFWSSDIYSTWDMLKRSVPAGLNFTASGMPYWDTDIAGFFSPFLAADYKPEHPPLISGTGAETHFGNYSDYPELFVRWFEWAAFQPVMRAHGERDHNEVWSYGAQAEPILAKYLRLRYQLLPYTYSVAFRSYQTGAPYMRALFMDFPNDPRAANIPDEYMYGPAFLVAPVTGQGATHRTVYLPAGCDWYNYWTNERLRGGQTIDVAAPIDTLPLFVRAGSIVLLGVEVKSADEPQPLSEVRVYPGADASFGLYQDDGATYAYESKGGNLTTLTWTESTQTLTHSGPAAWSGPDAALVSVVKPAPSRKP
jgi:alpha-glucosidase/alpha-D-xyloside xylohydrolase